MVCILTNCLTHYISICLSDTTCLFIVLPCLLVSGLMLFQIKCIYFRRCHISRVQYHEEHQSTKHQFNKKQFTKHQFTRDNTTRGNPTVGGPLVGFLFEIPHFPRGYRVVPTSKLPTWNFTEWVNELTFLRQKRTIMSKNCFFSCWYDSQLV